MTPFSRLGENVELIEYQGTSQQQHRRNHPQRPMKHKLRSTQGGKKVKQTPFTASPVNWPLDYSLQHRGLKRFGAENCKFQTDDILVLKSSILSVNFSKVCKFQPHVLYFWTKKTIF